ncbi:MAG: hypothetical protein CL867_06845 [Cytophagaceae bacterium]|nr:hypothetical protein [Cytophagaceae bacterium]|tara:strand:- start:34 stop:570 length:537 start_codon:yes stop_codon:yes gene_type:complete
MKKILLILFVFIANVSLKAQENSFRQDVLTYLEINGTTQQYSEAIDKLFDLLKRQYASQKVEEKVWTALRKESQGELGKIKAMLVSAYRGTYTQEDIQSLIAFYKTDAGKQLLQDQTAMTTQQRQEASAFYNGETGQKVLTSRDKISQSVAEVSQIWSRDLYQKMRDKLAEKGYLMQE